MNVWVRMTRKKSPCFYCNKEVETGTYQIVCQYYMKTRGGKNWVKHMIFHTDPNCWLERAITELQSRPVIETKGRKPKQLSDPIKEERYKILRRRASVLQRIDREMSNGMRPAKLAHMTEMLEKMREEIKECGGVPESWK